MALNDQKYYTVSLDLPAKIITGIIAAAAVGLSIVGFYVMCFGEERVNFNASLPWILPGSILLVIVVICQCLRITGYVVQKNSLKILRPITSVEIDYATIREVLTPSAADMRGTYRLFGNGGVFGYFGIFRNSTFGIMRWYATRISGFVMVVDSENQKLILTPDNPDLAEVIRQRCNFDIKHSPAAP